MTVSLPVRLQKCIRLNFVQKALRADGGIDYFVSTITEGALKPYGVMTVEASNDGREVPLDLSHYNRQLVIDGKGGLAHLLGGQKNCDELLEGVETLMKAEPGFVSSHTEALIAQARMANDAAAKGKTRARGK